MIDIKSKKITLPLCLGVIAVLLSPALTQADTAIVLAASSATGNVAAVRAAEQRAAQAKRDAEAQQPVVEKKADEAQQPVDEKKAVEAQQPVDEQKEKAAEK